MRTITRAFIPFAVVALLAAPLSAGSPDEIPVTATRLGENLFLLVGAGGNMAASVGEDGVLLVDSDYEHMNRKLRDAIATVKGGQVRYLVNTHWHFDHVGGNAEFGGTGSTIIAHENVRRSMASDQHIAILEVDTAASPRAALPVVTYSGGMTLHLNGEEISVLHFPLAHSGGDSVIHFRKADVIHTGDIFFNCGYPFIDVSDGGTIDGLIAAVQAILEMCDDGTRIIPGHGAVATRNDLGAYLGMLRTFRDLVAAEIAAGKDLDTILESGVTAAVDEEFGKVYFTPEKFTEMVYRSLKR